MNIGKLISQDDIQFNLEFKKIDMTGSGCEEKIRNYINAGFTVIGHDTDYVFMLPNLLAIEFFLRRLMTRIQWALKEPRGIISSPF